MSRYQNREPTIGERAAAQEAEIAALQERLGSAELAAHEGSRLCALDDAASLRRELSAATARLEGLRLGLLAEQARAAEQAEEAAQAERRRQRDRLERRRERLIDEAIREDDKRLADEPKIAELVAEEADLAGKLKDCRLKLDVLREREAAFNRRMCDAMEAAEALEEQIKAFPVTREEVEAHEAKAAADAQAEAQDALEAEIAERLAAEPIECPDEYRAGRKIGGVVIEPVRFEPGRTITLRRDRAERHMAEQLQLRAEFETQEAARADLAARQARANAEYDRRMGFRPAGVDVADYLRGREP
jgi:hypothetical protein